jgi:group I intron endonuclease
MGWIYLITNKIDGKCYVGQTRQKKVETRWKSYKYYHTGYIGNAIQKYGIDNFEFSILHELSNEELNNMEILEIRNRQTLIPTGYNIQKGGILCPEMSEDTRVKISLANKGKTRSEEIRKKISLTQKGRIITPEHRLKLSKARKGVPLLKPQSEISKQKRSLALAGKYFYNNRQRSIDKFTLDGIFVENFKTQRSAARSIDVHHELIGKCCKGLKTDYGGFIWKYAQA